MQPKTILAAIVFLFNATATAKPGHGDHGNVCWVKRILCGKTTSSLECEKNCEGTYLNPGAGHCVQVDNWKWFWKAECMWNRD